MSEGEKTETTEPGAAEPSRAEPGGGEPAATAPAEPAANAAPEAVASPSGPDPSSTEDAEAEVLEVDPVVDRPKSAAQHSAHHLPPPPPSIRVKSSAGSKARRLEVTGNPRLAQDLMTRKLFTIGQDDVIAHLEEHMEAFRFRHLPVVEDRKLIGLISHADLLRVSASLFSAKAKLQDELIHQLPAKHVMQRELVTVRPTDTLERVAEVMWEGKLGCVLVTEEDGILVGIITEGDFIRLAHHFLVRESAKA